ncbi:type II secretion system protein [Novipirellula rosea]|uniref:Prepilin-type N-terminal cleavage/methylation domain-containing protein n=1 Tax=Novipirellula rosea TaxID=1031540 RepID=A0ABP8MX36_9BACT
MSSHNNPVKAARHGFTLVEILVVITIIGILTAIAIPAINNAVGTARDTAIKMELGTIADLVQRYSEEYHDYPPDFSDWDVVERHFRKAFPRINDNELRILAQFTHVTSSGARCNTGGGPTDPRTNTSYSHYPHAIDRAEALVFCLGGFSKDIQRPFTGVGGPLVLATGGTDPYVTGTATNSDFLQYQYNTDRDGGTLDMVRLSVTVSGGNATSSDDGSNALGFFALADPFPVYTPKNSSVPFAYFDSRTYDTAFGTVYTSGAPVWYASQPVASINCYCPAAGGATLADVGAARPMASTTIDTTPPTTIQGSTVAGTVLEFANKNTFQLISGGRDGNYGGTMSGTGVGSAAHGISVFPLGIYYNPFFTHSSANTTIGATASSIGKYQDDDVMTSEYGVSSRIFGVNAQLDNNTNFCDSSILGNELP